MSDVILLIWSDVHGNPNINGGHGHFVRVSDNPHMHPVAQMTAGGAHPDADCADACTRSALLDRGKDVPVRIIESEEGTTANGTLIDHIGPALDACAVPSHVQGGDPPAGYIMNPASGVVLPPSQWPTYLAVSRHAMVVIDGAIPVDNPNPTGGVSLPNSEEDDMANPHLIQIKQWGPGANDKQDRFIVLVRDPDGTGTVYIKSNDGFSAYLAQSGALNGGPTALDWDMGLVGEVRPDNTIAIEGVRKSDGKLWQAWTRDYKAWGARIVG